MTHRFLSLASCALIAALTVGAVSDVEVAPTPAQHRTSVSSAQLVTVAKTSKAKSSKARPAAKRGGMRKQFCTYSAHTIGQLRSFERLVGGQVNCALLFNDKTRNWRTWSDPWFLHSLTDKNYAWPTWKKSKAGRRLIVTTSLTPVRGMPRDWLRRGAAGQYKKYGKRLAASLVKAGLGDSVIRLSHEANGKWNFDRVPDSKTGQRQWRKFWAKTVTAMRSVKGAKFRFDWTVNYKVRPKLSLKQFYPGSKYVDIVGLDAYDENTRKMTGRFRFQQTRAGGINEVIRFAKARRKQLSFPEWGILPVRSAMQGGGDQPDYVMGIGRTIAKNNFAYTSYWYAHADTRSLLQKSRKSLAALRKCFGRRGVAR